MTTTNTDDKNVRAVVSLSNVLADKDAHISALQKMLARAQDDVRSISKVCDEYRAELSKCKEMLIDANMALQSQQARPLACVEEELNAVKDQLAETASQYSDLLQAVIASPKSFVEAVEYLDDIGLFNLPMNIDAVKKVKELTGLDVANANRLVNSYISRKGLAEEDKFWVGVEDDKKKGCAGCSGGCCGNRVLVIPDESGTGSISGYPEQVYDTAGNVSACTMGCADTQSVSVFPDSEWPNDKAFNDVPTPTVQPPVEPEGTNDTDWHLEDDEIPF